MARARQVSQCMYNFFSSFLLVSDGLSPIKKNPRAPEYKYFFWPSAYKDNIIKWSLCPVDPCLSRRGDAGRRRGEATRRGALTQCSPPMLNFENNSLHLK